eukprot:14456623-Heterocapsa_arctica.AAC.1
MSKVIVSHVQSTLTRFTLMSRQQQIGASAFAGWGMWSPGNPNFKDNGPLKGTDQGSYRAE